jgi:hypothetical protein
MNNLNEEENARDGNRCGTFHGGGGCLVPIKVESSLSRSKIGAEPRVEQLNWLHPPPVVQNANICACLGVKLVIYLARGGAERAFWEQQKANKLLRPPTSVRRAEALISGKNC